MLTSSRILRSWKATRRGFVRVGAPIALALGLAGAALVYAPPAAAQCLKCSASNVETTCEASGAWDFCCVEGFILANNNANGTASISMTVDDTSLSIDQTFNSDGCCVAPYANIGIFDGCQASDQYGQAGSHLPLKLKDIALLQGAWTFQVPPLKSDEQYRVYFEMFLSTEAAGYADGGNLTIVFFWNNYGFDPANGHADVNGGMDTIDYHNPVGQGQGPFVDYLYPKGKYTPDSDGVITVDSTDVKAVLDSALDTFPEYYNGDLYLSHLSVTEEAGAFHGTVKTSYLSFAIQKTGSDIVYTPPFTADHWDGSVGAGGMGAGGADGGTSMGGSAGGTATGGSATGGASAGRDGGGTSGRTGTAGTATGGSATGGSATGGSATGGRATGGSSTGGSATGGSAMGGSATGTGGSGTAGGGTGTTPTAPSSADSSSGCGSCRVPSSGSNTSPLAGALLMALVATLRRRRQTVRR